MRRLARAITHHRVWVIVIAVLLLIPSVLGMMSTRVNYDLLAYLPGDLSTVVGQDILIEDFGIGSFSFLIVEGLPPKDVAALKRSIEQVEHVSAVLWYDTLLDVHIPMEVLPNAIYEAFNRDGATLIIVLLDTTTSEEGSLIATESIRALAEEKCRVAGMSALIVDLRNLSEREEPVYIAIAVVCACAIMMLLLDNWLIPFVFLLGIGAAVLYNMGTNGFGGDISYITKALASVLQLAVTMDYSIFLWHSYAANRRSGREKESAMTEAICETVVSVLGSSATTMAGFLAFCAMSFTLGVDLGWVMAKGVAIGLIASLTLLPALILVLDRPLRRTTHKPFLPSFQRLAAGLVKRRAWFLIPFVLLIVPAYMGNSAANRSVYYDMAGAMPKDIPYVVDNARLMADFNMGASYLVMIDSKVTAPERRALLKEMRAVEGVQLAVGLESVIGPRIPTEVLPRAWTQRLQSDEWALLLISSQYHSSSDEMNAQLDRIQAIAQRYDETAMLVGEAPLVKDMIAVTDTDFRIVTLLSLVAVFGIILIVTRSLTLPIVLVAVIEFAVFVNMAVSYLSGTAMVFIGPICISTIQLGSTVDYAILLNAQYTARRAQGQGRLSAVTEALVVALPSILTSALGFFGATFGVSMYTEIDVIRTLCLMMAMGAIISMLCVALILPGLLCLCDPVIRRTTWGLRKKTRHEEG